MGFGETVAVEGPGSDALKRAASKCETSLLSNFPNASANRFMRGAHHRRCAREGLTGSMMPHRSGYMQAQQQSYIFRVRNIFQVDSMFLDVVNTNSEL